MRKLNVIATQSPIEGLKILHHNAANIDLVISDIVMPEMSGIELIEKFIKYKPDIKVIFITGFNQIPSLQSRLDNLNFPILKKPFDFNILVDLVIKSFDS